MSPSDLLELSLPADPALAHTARMFAGSLSEHLEGAAPHDLKLAFSELLAAAIDAGSHEVTFRVDLQAGEIQVRGVAGALGDAGGLEEHQQLARAYRTDLLDALFPGIRVQDDVQILPLTVAE